MIKIFHLQLILLVIKEFLLQQIKIETFHYQLFPHGICNWIISNYNFPHLKILYFSNK